MNLTSLLKEFMLLYFSNSSSTCLRELLNNRSYCFKVNREASIQVFININIKLKTISYKKVTLSINNFKELFNKLISNSNTLLEDKLLLNVSKSDYKDITLEEYSKFEDRSLTTPFKCFRDLSPNQERNNNFLKDKIFNNLALFNRFFSLKDS